MNVNTSTAARLLAAGISIATCFGSLAASLPSVTSPAPTVSPTPSYTVRYADIQITQLNFVTGSNGSVFSKSIAGYRFIRLNVALKTLNTVGTPQFSVLGKFSSIAPVNYSQTTVLTRGMAGSSELIVPIELRVPDPAFGTNLCQLEFIADSNQEVSEILRQNNVVTPWFFLGRDEKGPFVGTIDNGIPVPGQIYDCKVPVAGRMEMKAKVR